MASISQELRFTALMQEIDSLRARLDARSAAPQLAFSSFDSGPGHGIDETDPDTGQPVASFGTQFDGSHGAVPYSGPIPPVPSGFTLEGAPAVLSVKWEGQFDGGDGIVTMDWTHAEVHASQDPEYTAEYADTIIGTINTPRGGKVTAVVGPGTWYVRLVSRSAAGKRSIASTVESIVIESSVDIAPIEADLEAAEAAIAAAKAKADAAFADAGSAAAAASAAQGTANSAQTAAGDAAAAAGTAQTTANNAATAASTAQGTANAAQTAAGNAQTTANTANTAAGNAQTAANNALKKFTVSANVPSGTSNNGDVWWRKDANGAIIGQWEYQTASPAGWKVRTTDGGIITNMAVSNLVAGTGTMSSALINKLFSDVVVAKMAVAEEFIGANAILTNSITAPKIVASEQLSAKVAEFLTVNADMVNTNDLWADTGWIAAARSHILTVLQNTNGEGYTSTVTGQGLRVTKTEGGNTFDVIRLGTFGEDFLGISDGTGKARAVITGAGAIGSQSIYTEEDVYSNGRLMRQADAPHALGVVVKGSQTYSGTTWAVANTTGRGIIEIAFRARKGRVYKLTMNIAHQLSAVPDVATFNAGWSMDTQIPTISNTSTRRIFGTDVRINHTRAATSLTANASETFIPFPASAGGNAEYADVRVLVFGARQGITTGSSLNVTNAQVTIEDAGRDNAGSWVGVNDGTSGTTTLPAATEETLITPLAPVRCYKRVAGSSTGFTLDTSQTTHVIIGRHGTEEWVSFIAVPAALKTALNGSTSLGVISQRISLTPDYVKLGLGTLAFGVSSQQFQNPVPADLLASSYWPYTAVEIGAWGQGVERQIELTTVQQDMLKPVSNADFGFGVGLTPAELADPKYAMRIPVSGISVKTIYRKRAS